MAGRGRVRSAARSADRAGAPSAAARRHGGKRGVAALTKALDELGAEPVSVDGDRLVLANCPFRPLSQRRPELVCEVYRAFCAGLVGGVGVKARAVAEPSPGHCCVAIRW